MRRFHAKRIISYCIPFRFSKLSYNLKNSQVTQFRVPVFYFHFFIFDSSISYFQQCIPRGKNGTVIHRTYTVALFLSTLNSSRCVILREPDFTGFRRISMGCVCLAGKSDAPGLMVSGYFVRYKASASIGIEGNRTNCPLPIVGHRSIDSL